MDGIPLQDILRQIPSVDALLQTEAVQEALQRHPRKVVLEAIRLVLDQTRAKLLREPREAAAGIAGFPALDEAIGAEIERLSRYTLRPVINATGIVIHTNLGRSLLPEEAIERLALICSGYNNLEYDLEQGARGSRYVHAEALLRELTGAEAALVVNNNAGAVFLVLNTLARDREAVVSRGQLVEIGGSFRIPDVMAASGAVLREVGTTNRTHLRDYASAISDRTALLMKVHTSNFRIVGFTAEVSLEELVKLGREHSLPVIEDLGSGCFVNLARFGLHGEATVQDAVCAGADIVTFSGDKLLGGPQAGIVVGRKDLVERCRKNPLTRALRVDKMTLAALEATLRLYRDERQAVERIPTLRMIAAPLPELEEKAEALAAAIRAAGGAGAFDVEVRSGYSQVGGGSLPAQDLETRVVAVRSDAMSAAKIEASLRCGDPPIIGRIESDLFLMDVRTLKTDDIAVIAEAFAASAQRLK
jgi:L-seryl-tRNA(Ser) seleniumtransferase